MNRVKIDIVERLREAITNNMRPGTGDSDVNPFALPVVVTYGHVELAIREIELLRRELTAARNINWRYAARACNIDTTVEPQPWGSPYAMNPENWT